MFSSSMRVSFAILLRRSGAAYRSSTLAKVGLSGEKEMVLRLDEWGTAVVGDSNSTMETESVNDETG
jgi:hypothetical protein